MRLPVFAALAFATSLTACALKPVGPDYSMPAAAYANKPGAAAPFALAPASGASGASGTAPFADAPLQGYTGTVLIDVQFETPLLAGSTLQLSLRFQACTEEACLAPATQSMTIQASRG